MEKLVISIDFDGTITNFDTFPLNKALNRRAKDAIVKLYNDGHTIIINTMREGKLKKEAIDFLEYWEIPFHHFNENCPKLKQKYGNDPRKIGCDIHIDDRSLMGIDWDVLPKLVDFLSKKTIICIVGESGSGKTSIANYIEASYNIPQVVSRTTRGKRYDKEGGHLFVSNNEFDTYKEDEMIAYTMFGDNRYCCLKNDLSDRCIYVIDEDGIDYLVNKFGNEYNLITIRCKMDESSRLMMVGEDRINRDKGRFNKTNEEYDFVINVNNNIVKTYELVDDVMYSIFSKRINQHSRSILDMDRFLK